VEEELFVSGDFTKLSDERRLVAESLLPVLDCPGRVLDVLHHEMPDSTCLFLKTDSNDSWMLLTKFNWAETAVRFRFEDLKHLVPEFKDNPEQILVYHCYEFWTNSYYKVQIYEDQVFFLGYLSLTASGDSNKTSDVSSQAQIDIPSHGARVFSIRNFNEQKVTFIGSNLHISGGKELTHFDVFPEDRTLRFVVNVGRVSSSRCFWIYLGKDKLKTAKLVGAAVAFQMRDCGRGIVCVTMDVKLGDNLVELEW